MKRALIATSLAAALASPPALASCAGELPGPEVCDNRTRCSTGHTCVLGRCRKDKTIPVSMDATRIVFSPVDLAWMTGDGTHPMGQLGDKIVLGKKGVGEVLVLGFSLEIPEGRRLQRALLELDPLPRCDESPGRVGLELAHVLSPWSSEGLARGRRPRLGIPMRLADASATPPRALALDVTEVVRAWQEERGRYHGVAILASGDSPTGACYSSGVSAGVGPRLSVYLWPLPTDAGVDGGEADGGVRDGGS